MFYFCLGTGKEGSLRQGGGGRSLLKRGGELIEGGYGALKDPKPC